MAVLGSLGNFYVVLLFLILIGGSGAVAFSFSKSFWDKSQKFMEKKGGKFMNKWIKLAVTSFAGILIASFALGITNNLGQDPNSAHSSHGAGQMTAGQVSGTYGSAGQANYGQMAQNPMNGSYDARLYQLQMNMMQLQQQVGQLMQYYASQQMNPWGMGGTPYGGSMYNPNMGNINSMNGMSNMSNIGNMNSNNSMSNMNNSGSSGGGMSGGGMSMM